jgi:hypothetical protein
MLAKTEAAARPVERRVRLLSATNASMDFHYATPLATYATISIVT